jgi:hypothetical protein
MISGVTASSISKLSASSTITLNSPGTVSCARDWPLAIRPMAVCVLVRSVPSAIWSRRKSATSSLLVTYTTLRR